MHTTKKIVFTTKHFPLILLKPPISVLQRFKNFSFFILVRVKIKTTFSFTIGKCRSTLHRHFHFYTTSTQPTLVQYSASRMWKIICGWRFATLSLVENVLYSFYAMNGRISMCIKQIPPSTL